MNPAGPPPLPLVDPLTRREQEILELLAAGQSAPEIADRLTLAVSSVKWYLRQVYSKLGVNSKQGALARAAELGLLAAPAGPPPAPPQHNLPLQVTRFFGREADIAQLIARLAEHRLVTLAGAGGVGKTRLSLQTAQRLVEAHAFADGVWFTGLAPLVDPALVAETVAASLGLHDEPARPILDTLTDYLRPRQALLILDNCEHLLEACARLAEHLLTTCPRIKLLTSSREPLGIPGEAVVAVPSLPFPAAGEAIEPDRLGDYAAVRLLIDRVHLTQPDFVITPQNAPALARITQRLDGIPLALELAAARISLLGTEALADRLDDVFRVLTGGSRTALPRQQTLRATLDWSYRLLNGDQQRLLQRLAVFAGGCTLAAAEAVCAGDGLEADQVLEVIGALVSKSMVTASQAGAAGQRYSLLETVRQYAREKLNDAGESTQVQRRHRDYYLAFAESAFPKLTTADGPTFKPLLAAEHDNFRQALEWSFGEPSEVEAAIRLLIILSTAGGTSFKQAADWHLQGIAISQARADIDPKLKVRLLDSASGLIAIDDHQACLNYAKQAVEIARGLGPAPANRETLMWSLLQLASSLMADIADTELAVAPTAEAEAILQRLGPEHFTPEQWLRVNGLFAVRRAELLNRQGRYREAITLSEKSIAFYEAAGMRHFANLGHTSMGAAYRHLGEYGPARQHLLTTLQLLREMGNWNEGYVLLELAQVDLRLGKWDRALEYSLESIRRADEVPNRNIIARVLGVLATLSARQGHARRAAKLAGASAAMFARQKRTAWEDTSLDALLPGWRTGADSAGLEAAYAAGQALSNTEAVAYALATRRSRRPTPVAA